MSTVFVRVMTGALLLVLAACARADTQGAARRAASLTRFPRPTVDSPPEKSAKAAVAFSRAMDEGLEKTKSGAMVESETSSIEAKLVAIALYRSQHRDLFDEITSRYVATAPTGSRSGNSPSIVARDASEPYRLIWEYYLLTPLPAGAAPGYRQRAYEALAELGNGRSAFVLGHLLVTELESSSDPGACSKCPMPIITLVRIGKPEALVALADAFPAAPDQGTARAAARQRAIELTVKTLKDFAWSLRIQAAWRELLQEARTSADSNVRAFALDLEEAGVSR